jgi:hypothetical protein
MLARIDDTLYISDNHDSLMTCKLKRHSCPNNQETENYPCLKTRRI